MRTFLETTVIFCKWWNRIFDQAV